MARNTETRNTETTKAQDLAIEHGVRRDDGTIWIPGCYVEDDPGAEETLIAEYGSPRPSGYMSEECGWEIDDDVVVAEIARLLDTDND
jgi:hypothetical protein